MDESDDLPGADSDLAVERGGTYEHDDHGEVEVTGIWKGVEQVDRAHRTDEKDVFIVRYSTAVDGERIDELTDTLDEFLQKIE